MNVTFTLNGKEITVDYEEGMSVLDILREICQIKSCKDGCSGQGFCGACTILFDGRARMSCRLKPAKIEGKEITTIEGLIEEEKKIISKSLVKEGAIQCGFCTPGITLKIKSFLDLCFSFPEKKLPKPENVSRENSTVETAYTGCPMKRMNFWMKTISMNM